jgi:hypothetical protein
MAIRVLNKGPVFVVEKILESAQFSSGRVDVSNVFCFGVRIVTVVLLMSSMIMILLLQCWPHEVILRVIRPLYCDRTRTGDLQNLRPIQNSGR